MCHWPSGSPVPVWLLCCVPCPARGWEQEHILIWGQPWSAVMPGACFLLPSLLEVLQGFAFGLWRKRNGDACPYSWVLPPRAAPAPGNAGGVQCVMWSKRLKNSAHWLVLFVSWCTMAFYAGEEEGGWNFLRACGLCVQGIAAQKCICLCLLWCGWSGSSAISGQCCQLTPCALPSSSAWLSPPGWEHCKGHGGRGSAALAVCRGLCGERPAQGSLLLWERAPSRGSRVFPAGNRIFLAWNLWEGVTRPWWAVEKGGLCCSVVLW